MAYKELVIYTNKNSFENYLLSIILPTTTCDTPYTI